MSADLTLLSHAPLPGGVHENLVIRASVAGQPRQLVLRTAPPEWMDAGLRQRYRLPLEIQRGTGLSLAELGLRFLLAARDFASVIPGAASVGQLAENVHAVAAGPRPADVQARLAALGRVFDGLYR